MAASPLTALTQRTHKSYACVRVCLCVWGRGQCWCLHMFGSLYEKRSARAWGYMDAVEPKAQSYGLLFVKQTFLYTKHLIGCNAEPSKRSISLAVTAFPVVHSIHRHVHKPETGHYTTITTCDDTYLLVQTQPSTVPSERKSSCPRKFLPPVCRLLSLSKMFVM